MNVNESAAASTKVVGAAAIISRALYRVLTAVVHPHAFRHLYAKNFLERHNDIALLADLLGHESISTTRIYLRKSTLEQQVLIDRIVDW